MAKLKVINLYGGAGCGKSTTAAGLFFKMKTKGASVELVCEYAKDLVWAERNRTFKDQLYIFAKQNHRLFCLQDKVEFAINDSPLLLSHIYAPAKYYAGFTDLINSVYSEYENYNFFINRVKPYNPKGRNENEDGARAKDTQIKECLLKYQLPFTEVSGDNFAPDKILDAIEFQTWPNIK